MSVSETLSPGSTRAHGWLQPIGLAEDASPAWTRLGSLDGLGEPVVDPRGVVQVAPGSPGIDWWIAGDDRWYFPSRESTVRQSLVGGTPVVATRMRVKGGDVCARSYVVTLPGDDTMSEAVVIEVENSTGVPCGIAFAVRPFGVTGPTPVHRVSIEGGTVLADGTPVLVLPREPAGALAGNFDGGDLADRVVRGEATGAGFAPLECPRGLAQAVVVVPMAHRGMFRVVLPVPGPDGIVDRSSTIAPGAVAPAENVAKGWRAQVRDTATVRVPDPRVQAVLDAAAPWLLATTGTPVAARGRSIWNLSSGPRWDHVAATAGALDRLGLSERAGLLLARAAAAYGDEETDGGAWLVDAFAAHLARDTDERFAAAVAETVVRIIAGSRRGRGEGPGEARTLLAGAFVLGLAGEPRAGDEARAAAEALACPSAAGPAPVTASSLAFDRDRAGLLWAASQVAGNGDATSAWEVLDRLLDEVSPTGVWSELSGDPGDAHAVGVGAGVISLALDLLICAIGDGMRCAAHVPDAWVGRPLDAQRVRTPLGPAGFAVRWHGDRPALLWEAAGPAASPPSAELVVEAPGLDPEWQGEGASGEALLAPRAHERAASGTGSRISGLQVGPSRRST